jgi:hypothetical protein
MNIANRYLWPALCSTVVLISSCCILNPDAPRPSMQYKQQASGCSDLFVYKSNESGTEYVLVELNRQIRPVSTQPTTFDIATTETGLRVEINTYSRKPNMPRYCSDVLDGSDPSPEVWRAKSGRVTITVSEDNPAPGMGYQTTVRINDVTFKSRDGEEVFLKEAVFENVTVGWYPG